MEEIMSTLRSLNIEIKAEYQLARCHRFAQQR
jgi:hypothetical protein